MTKKQFFILGIICISTLVGSSVIKETGLYFMLIMLLGVFLFVFFLQKSWALKIGKGLLVMYGFIAVFLGSSEMLYFLFPQKQELHPVQDYGGITVFLGLVLALLFSGFLIWANKKNTNRKTILIYLGSMALCLLPVLLKRMMY